MDDEQEPEVTSEPGGTTLRNEGRDAGWYITSNVLMDRWARIIGPRALQVYQTFRSLCKGTGDQPFPRVRQQDWAEFMGMGLQAYQQNLKILEDVGLIDIRRPTGEDRLQHKPSKIILWGPDQVTITPEILERYHVKPLSKECRFNDPLEASSEWSRTMFRPVSMKRTKPTKEETGFANSENGIYESENPGDIENHMSGGDSDNVSYIKGQGIKDSDYPTDSLRVSDETRSPKQTSHISMKDRTLQKIHTKSPKSTPTESQTLPPIESMPLPLQAWYDLPLVAKPSAKTYDRCRRQIDRLKCGLFPTSFLSLNETWRTQYNIPTTATAHEWIDKELVAMIEKLGVMLTDAAYWPENKEQWFKGLTFMDFVFCPRTARSWLLGLKHRGLSKLERKDTRPRSTYREPEGFIRSPTPWVTPKRDRDAQRNA